MTEKNIRDAMTPLPPIRDAMTPPPLPNDAKGAEDETLNDLPLSIAMRKATRKIHRESDALVNLKLVYAFTYPALYAEAIGLFYPIYRSLESLILASPSPSLRPFAALLVQFKLQRTAAFEVDIAYHSRGEWIEKTNDPSCPPALLTYLARLEACAKDDPDLLVVYAYHMYMALLSGGQILKRLTTKFLLPKKGKAGTGVQQDGKEKGLALYTFETEQTEEIKAALRAAVDAVEGKGGVRNTERRQAFLNESIRLFHMNNEVVRSFEPSRAGRCKLRVVICLVLLSLLLFLVLLGRGLRWCFSFSPL